MAIPRNLANLANQLNTDGEVPKIEVGNSKVEVTDTGSNGTIVFNTDGSERMRVTSAGNVGIGVTSPNGILQAGADGNALIYNNSSFSESSPPTTGNDIYLFRSTNDGSFNFSARPGGGGSYRFWVGSTQVMGITSGGNLLIGKTTTASATVGINLSGTLGFGGFTRADGAALQVNRQNDDGELVQFLQADAQEGSISVSGSTVSYNGGHLSRWAQMFTKPDLVKGTVMSNLDDMNVYIAPTTYWTEEDELPEGVNVGDVKVETHEVENEQLNKVKVSDVEGDANVAGVFVNWTYDEAHQVDEINMAMTGDMIIRIGEGVTVARGDLLMSAGDGTAKPQGDDIVRSKTVAKVTSTHVTCTYEDGSYCVPCVLMAC